MLFLKSVPLSRALSLLTCNISARRTRMICPVVFFAAVLASLLVRLERNGAEAQSYLSQQTQGSLSHNLPNLNETYANAAMESPRKEYSLNGSSLAAAQSVSVVVVNPGAYQTSDPENGGQAVNHKVKLEYFEGGGPAMALLSWTALAGISCLPDAPLIGAAPRTGGGESVATTATSQAPKKCGLKQSD